MLTVFNTQTDIVYLNTVIWKVSGGHYLFVCI